MNQALGSKTGSKSGSENSSQMRSVWGSLQATGLVSGEMPASDGAPPWYVRVMMGGSAWLGSVFLFSFVVGVLHFVLQSPTASMAVGGIACAGAYAVFRKAGNSDAMAQFGLATTFVGQSLFAYGLLAGNALPANATWAAFAAFEALVAATLPNAISRYVATIGALFGLVMTAGVLGLQPLVPGLVAALCAAIWMNELRWGWRADAWRAIGFGAASALLLLQGTRLGGELLGGLRDASLGRSLFGKGVGAALPWLGDALVALVLVGVIDTIPAFSSRLLIGGRKTLSGSAIGGIAETQELLDFCAAKGIVADCEMTTMPRINEAFERMEKGDVRYRFVVDMQT